MGLEVAALTLGAVPAIQYRQQKKALEAQQDIQKEQRKIQNRRSARERRQQIREARIRAANLEVAGVVSGATGSSSVVTGQSNISNQLASNLSFLDANQRSVDRIGAFQNTISKYQTQARNLNTAIDLGMKAFSVATANPGLFSSTPKKAAPTSPFEAARY